MSCILYNGTNTLFVASYAGVDLIVLIKKLLDMGNSCNRVRKTRRNMPIEKENEVREKARLAMERVRHGLDISTDTVIDPNIVDDITTSTSEPWVTSGCVQWTQLKLQHQHSLQPTIHQRAMLNLLKTYVYLDTLSIKRWT